MCYPKWGQQGADCRDVAHQMLLCWSWGHWVRVRSTGGKQIKCFVQGVIKLLELAAMGVCRVGVSRIERESNKFMGDRCTNGSWRNILWPALMQQFWIFCQNINLGDNQRNELQKCLGCWACLADAAVGMGSWAGRTSPWARSMLLFLKFSVPELTPQYGIRAAISTNPADCVFYSE